ncbi:MAG: AbrB/MazE/SpoVT family DNA-binding domain-containing protein [Candidatus Woesearchaeota archaeon]|nr:AbrB/MazE/SpoVT family DNA-binding domain-containing protein [Candidatus Woesearchaeota archaeon]
MEIRTVTISSKRQITIPKAFSALQEGAQAMVINDGEKMIIKPLPKHVSEAALLSQAALAECWNSPEDDEAFAYLQ